MIADICKQYKLKPFFDTAYQGFVTGDLDKDGASLRYFVDQGRKISHLRLYTEFPLKFLKYFFIKGLCRNGWYGFCFAIVAANRNFMRLAKTRELQINERLAKK